MPVHLDDWMACEQRIAEALCDGLPFPVSCRPQRARVVIQCFEEDRLPRFDGRAGRIRQLLQGDDVGIQLGDHGRDAIGIVSSVSPHTHARCRLRHGRRGRSHIRTPLCRDGWKPSTQIA